MSSVNSMPKWVVYKADGGWAWRFERACVEEATATIYETRASARLAAKRAAKAEYEARLEPCPVLQAVKRSGVSRG